jgi:hypothetical protein
MAKPRTSIPLDIASEVLFLSDNTCCKCRNRGKTVQIHHVNEDASDNKLENMAVLCLECHNETQITGGFGRKLTAPLVIKYRNEWLLRVQTRRDEADKIAVSMMAYSEKEKKVTENNKESTPREPSIGYINSLPVLRADLLKKIKPELDSGVTQRMVEALSGYIDTLQAVLVTLSSYYLENHFGDKRPIEFFSELIASRFKWHWAHLEPYGYGTGGTIVRPIGYDLATRDVEQMVLDMVTSLVGYNELFDYEGWLKLWKYEYTGGECEDVE